MFLYKIRSRFGKNELKRSLLLLVICGWLVPALACNFPFRNAAPDRADDLRLTLTAIAVNSPADATPSPAGVANPVLPPDVLSPGETQVVTGILRPDPPALDEAGERYRYLTLVGDTLDAVARRFAVDPDQISSPQPLLGGGLLAPGQELLIPNQLGVYQERSVLLPDSEIIYSPSARDFDLSQYIDGAGGHLSRYEEMVKGEQLSGAEIVTKVARENSINPRLLLAVLEYRSGWVFGPSGQEPGSGFPIGFFVPDYRGLYYELVLTATHLGVGYYGWRSGERTTMSFPDGSLLRLSPGLNPGTAGLQVVFAKLLNQGEWRTALYEPGDFISLYEQMYGDPWVRAGQVEPLFPLDLTQPVLELPFLPGEQWSFTGGPHRSWNAGSPLGALDFSPVTGEPPCTPSKAWVTASAAGVVTRSSDNVLAVDLDGDGFEGTGWVLVYLHIADRDRVTPGATLLTDDPLGHPSCERGNSTGTHVHIARKFNGEWIPADGSLPFVLSGWQVRKGERSYQGELIKGEQSVTANPGGPSSSVIIR